MSRISLLISILRMNLVLGESGYFYSSSALSSLQTVVFFMKGV